MNGHHWLIRRNRVYYIRVRIPNHLIYLIKTSEFRYSLKTYNYYEALAKLPKESYKINLKINFLKGVDMRISDEDTPTPYHRLHMPYRDTLPPYLYDDE